ncbi:MAG: NAD(P)-dependent oxidoreductase [Chloroflexi bacterium]|nr:NAD(P)-dependent oxidoreductase [Chloroflexota bacterium]
MRILVLGGSGFIGPRVIRRLLERGHEVHCMDIAPNAPSLEDLRDDIAIALGDITLMDDVLEAMALSQPDRVLNLAYALGAGEDDPHPQVRLNILGMDNCIEAARIHGIRRVVYASSLAVYGPQRLHGERAVVEDDPRLGTSLYAASKIFNEHQADWYNRAFDMAITGVRPANITGPDKVRGSMDHVRCQVFPARGEPVQFPFRDGMTLPLHVEDIADVFVRVTLAAETQHTIYNSGGESLSLGRLADIVRGFLPDAEITFDADEGGREPSGLYLMDNSRLVEEFEVEYAPFEQRVMETINEARGEGLPSVGQG